MCDLQADVIACGPCGDVSQEVAQRLGSCKKLVSACFGTGVVAGCRQAKFPVLGSQAMLGHHGQGKLCQRLEAGNVCLGRLRELRVVPADLSHGPLLGKPAEFGGGADPSSYADGITVCPRVRGGHAMQNGRLSERDNARMAEAGVQPMQAGAAVFAKVELVSGRVLCANPSFLVRAGHARNVCLAGYIGTRDLQNLASQGEPEACGGASNDCLRRECVQKMLPHVWTHAVQSAALAVQVLV